MRLSVVILVVSALVLVYSAVQVSKFTADFFNYECDDFPRACRMRKMYIALIALSSVGVLVGLGRMGYINLRRFHVY
jgi:hypothetical protein